MKAAALTGASRATRAGSWRPRQRRRHPSRSSAEQGSAAAEPAPLQMGSIWQIQASRQAACDHPGQRSSEVNCGRCQDGCNHEGQLCRLWPGLLKPCLQHSRMLLQIGGPLLCRASLRDGACMGEAPGGQIVEAGSGAAAGAQGADFACIARMTAVQLAHCRCVGIVPG